MLYVELLRKPCRIARDVLRCCAAQRCSFKMLLLWPLGSACCDPRDTHKFMLQKYLLDARLGMAVSSCGKNPPASFDAARVGLRQLIEEIVGAPAYPQPWFRRSMRHHARLRQLPEENIASASNAENRFSQKNEQ